MSPLKKGTPGPVARRAFRTGTVVAALAGLTGIAGLYLADLIDLTEVALLVVLLFPVYLVLAASAINVWLGYGSDAIPLKRVTVPAEGAGPSDRSPGPSGERALSPVEGPRLHLALILGGVVVGVAGAPLGFPTAGFFALTFSLLTAWLAIGTFLLPRLEAYYGRPDAAGTDPGRALPTEEFLAEFKAGMTAALLACLVLAAFVALVTVLYAPGTPGPA